MKTTLISALVLLLAQAALGADGSGRPASAPFDGVAAKAPQSPIDKLVFARLEKLGVEPALLCSDAVFLRRVYLDVIGTLPTAKEAREFLNDVSPDKRRVLIDRLLERDEFADYWSMKWGDLLRVKAEFPINLWPKAVEEYHRWIRTSLKENKPYDRFVRELLTASGSNFCVGEANFYRAVQSKEPQTLAQTVALTFMGTRAEKWPKERLAGMAGFFSQVGYKETGEWKEEIVFFNPAKAGAAKTGTFPDGTTVQFSPNRDPREVFADWLITPKNPWFARNIVNRTWFWLMGRGIIQEPDDIRPDNPAVNPELLALLEGELVKSHYDLKHIYRMILNSQTYQLSAIPAGKGPKGDANFSHYPLRRLEAEVLIDALCQITGTTEKYSSAIPEPFSFIPEDQRSIVLADGSTTSSFLELFGRPARDTGLESERVNRTNAAQQLHMLNSSHINRKIEQSGKLQAIFRAKEKPRDIVTTLYLTILSRYPTPEELKIVADYSGTKGVRGGEVLVDLAWVLFNSAEFQYRH